MLSPPLRSLWLSAHSEREVEERRRRRRRERWERERWGGRWRLEVGERKMCDLPVEPL
jgi:hypothetical protein